MKKQLSVVLLTSSLVFSSSCGLLLHPERQGQTSGKFDPVIVGLNMIGLVFYLVPGIVAFAIDYSSGTIYLPNGSAAISPDTIHSPKALDSNFSKVKVEGKVTQDKLEAVLKEHFKRDIDLQGQDNTVLNAGKITQNEFAILNASLRNSNIY